MAKSVIAVLGAPTATERKGLHLIDTLVTADAETMDDRKQEQRAIYAALEWLRRLAAAIDDAKGN